MQEKVELRLERSQLLWLSLGAVLAMSLCFALGLVVGRRAARLEMPAVAQDPLAQLDADTAMHKELTFYKRLTAKEQAPLAPAPAPEKALPSPTAAPVVNKAPTPPPAVAVAPAADAAPIAPEPARVAQPPSGPAKPVEPSASTAPAGLAAGPAKTGEYTVQVSAFQTNEEAKAYAAALERKGFRPFIVTSSIAGKGTWYRVRLGRFRDESSALLAKATLIKSDIPGWVLKSE